MNIDLLKRLCETPGVPGREDRIREVIKSEIEGLFDEVTMDPMGSLLCKRNPTKKGKGTPKKSCCSATWTKLAFWCHTSATRGHIYIDPVGGFDPRNLFSRRVLVCTDDGDYKGVMNPGGKPVHIQEPGDAKKVPSLSEFFVDLGMGEKTKDKVKVGDYIVMDEPLLDLEDKVVSKALDNRVACWLGIESIRKLIEDGGKHECEIHVAFTTQEEVGLRGARTAAYAIKPDIGLGIDVTLACDTPGVPEHQRVTVQGEGVGLHIKDSSFIADIGLVREMEELAEKNKIPYQRTILARGGQDGAAAQQAALARKPSALWSAHAMCTP